jgi:hypothetical protein
VSRAHVGYGWMGWGSRTENMTTRGKMNKNNTKSKILLDRKFD